jgi:hypothetical protein
LHLLRFKCKTIKNESQSSDATIAIAEPQNKKPNIFAGKVSGQPHIHKGPYTTKLTPSINDATNRDIMEFLSFINLLAIFQDA